MAGCASGLEGLAACLAVLAVNCRCCADDQTTWPDQRIAPIAEQNILGAHVFLHIAAGLPRRAVAPLSIFFRSQARCGELGYCIEALPALPQPGARGSEQQRL
jgi:hypothetical protein